MATSEHLKADVSTVHLGGTQGHGAPGQAMCRYHGPQEPEVPCTKAWMCLMWHPQRSPSHAAPGTFSDSQPNVSSFQTAD